MTQAFPFKTEPFPHQAKEWPISRDLYIRAVFWQQGTGKTKITIDTAAWLYQRNEIDAVLVVAPNGVHRNWVDDEIPAHCPESINSKSLCLHYQSSKAATKTYQRKLKALLTHEGLSWLTISYDAFTTKNGKKFLVDFLDQRRVLYVLDEAHCIKNPTAKRTKSILMSAKYAPYRRILTGTPVAQGPFDVYSQVIFLDPGYWKRHGIGTFSEFKATFGVFNEVYNPHITKQFNEQTGRWERCSGGYVKVLKTYRRLDDLYKMLEPISTRVTKDDVLDIPEKLYQKRFVGMSPEQAKLYKQMRDESMVWLHTGEAEVPPQEKAPQLPAADCKSCGGQKEIAFDGYVYQCPDCLPLEQEDTTGKTLVSAELAMTRLLRLQQIICGYLPTDDESEPMHIIQGPNNRLQELCEIVESTPHKIIVWARFKLDITLILQKMQEMGIKAVRYDGAVTGDERAEAKALFKGVRPIYSGGQVCGQEQVPEEEQARVFVANPAAGATGLTFTEAKTVVYYSNSFKLIDRLQSEDRAHRIGQKNNVLYIDLVAEGTVDEEIVKALRNKFNVAREITGDRLKDWI